VGRRECVSYGHVQVDLHLTPGTTRNRRGRMVSFTLHVLLSLIDDESIASKLLLLLLGVLVIFRVCVGHHSNLVSERSSAMAGHTERKKSDPLNGSEATKLSLQVRLLSIIMESGHEESLERIASDLGVVLRFV
jgi:hypothetical protein